MLKITYTETGLHLEHLTQSLEEWTATRVVLSLRAGQRLFLESSTATVLIPAESNNLQVLVAQLRREDSETIAIAPCDLDYVEVSLKGTWIASDPHSSEGVFVVSLSHLTEFLIFKLWEATQVCRSSAK